jgi:hypothetical protein
MLLTTGSTSTSLVTTIHGPIEAAEPVQLLLRPPGVVSVRIGTGTHTEHNRQLWQFSGETDTLREFVRSLQWAIELAESQRVAALDEAIDTAMDGDQ